MYFLQIHCDISDKIAFIFKLFSPREVAKKRCFRPKLPEVSCVQTGGSPVNRSGFHLLKFWYNYISTFNQVNQRFVNQTNRQQTKQDKPANGEPSKCNGLVVNIGING